MRRTARENAFKLIFERLVNGTESKLSYVMLSEKLEGDDRTYFDELVNGTVRERAFLSQKIAQYSSGYSLDRIYKIDLSILLIATYEIIFLDDVPDKVSANEAVELAKTYSTDHSPSFVNGLLATFIKNKESIINERNSD
jgi:N utilization substance protein B